MKYQVLFSGENKKNISIRSADLPRVLSVNKTVYKFAVPSTDIKIFFFNEWLFDKLCSL